MAKQTVREQSAAAQGNAFAGVAHDHSPVPDKTRMPRIPDKDRTWLSLGVQWQARPNLTLIAGYTHVWVEASDINPKATDLGNAFRGDLAGEYDNAIDIATVPVNWLF
jgi:long-chain fatty acid transport protein